MGAACPIKPATRPGVDPATSRRMTQWPRCRGRSPRARAAFVYIPVRVAMSLVEVENLVHLQKILRAARRVKGITEVARRERLDVVE